MVLLIPNLICGVANLLILDSGVWSAYIVSSSLFVLGVFHCSIFDGKTAAARVVAVGYACGHAVYLALLRGRLGAAGWFLHWASADFGAFRHSRFL